MNPVQSRQDRGPITAPTASKAHALLLLHASNGVAERRSCNDPFTSDLHEPRCILISGCTPSKRASGSCCDSTGEQPQQGPADVSTEGSSGFRLRWLVVQVHRRARCCGNCVIARAATGAARLGQWHPDPLAHFGCGAAEADAKLLRISEFCRREKRDAHFLVCDLERQT